MQKIGNSFFYRKNKEKELKWKVKRKESGGDRTRFTGKSVKLSEDFSDVIYGEIA